MEQHPTLPLVAVSGIDDTVKVSTGQAELRQMFGPATTKAYSRTHLAQDIMRANTERPAFIPSSSFGRAGILQFLASRGITVRGDDEEGEMAQQCATQ